MKEKVVIIVHGGNVQKCYCDRADIEVEMIDFDNISEHGEEKVLAARVRVEEAERSMYDVY